MTCTGYDTDENGNVTCVHATYDPATFGGDAPDGRKVRGTIHWVSAKENTPLTARIYDRLFNVENPSDDSGVNSFEENLNPDSLTEKQGYGEVALATAKVGSSLCGTATFVWTRTLPPAHRCLTAPLLCETALISKRINKNSGEHFEYKKRYKKHCNHCPC